MTSRQYLSSPIRRYGQRSLLPVFLFLVLIGLVLMIVNILFVHHYSLLNPSFVNGGIGGGGDCDQHQEKNNKHNIHNPSSPQSLLRTVSSSSSSKNNNNARNVEEKQPASVISEETKQQKQQQHLKQPPVESKSEELELSACLIVMDDNHFLIEWLAYHYQTANLRNLIITSDPHSMTKPTHILERWKDKMNIVEWTEKDFLPSDFDERVQKRLKGNNKDPLLQNHRERQWQFNLECLRYHKKQNREWTMLIDTDEYLAINPGSLSNVFDDWHAHNISTSGNNPTSKAPIANSTSVPTILNSIQIPNKYYEESIQSPCIGMYRRQFTALESNPIDLIQQNVPDGFDGKNFQTMRWRKYGFERHAISYKTKKVKGKQCDEHIHRRVPNKVIIDLGRLRLQDLYSTNNKGNPHLPLDICPTNVYSLPSETPFVVHHYMGTPEQWFYRTSDKRGIGFRRARYIDLNRNLGKRETDLVRPWLQDFVDTIGTDEASRLLRNVGELEPIPSSNKAASSSNHYDTSVYINGDSSNINSTYKVGDIVMANYKGDGYWNLAEISSVYPDEYYNVFYFDDCSEEIALPVSNVRPWNEEDDKK